MFSKKFLLGFFALYLAALPLSFAAENYDLNEITPEIQEALQGRKGRYAELLRLKGEGILGENNEGFVAKLNDSPEASALLEAENKDREAIYQAIVDQNHLGATGLAQVKRTFAEVQRGKARPGDSIQLPSGEWIKKAT